MSKPLYKVGDLVRVKSFSEIKALEAHPLFVVPMREYCGYTYRVVKVSPDDDGYHSPDDYGYHYYNLDGCSFWNFSENTLELASGAEPQVPKKTWRDIKVGDRVRVRTLQSVLEEFPGKRTEIGECDYGSFYCIGMEGFAGFVVDISTRFSQYGDNLRTVTFNVVSDADGNCPTPDLVNDMKGYNWDNYMFEFFDDRETLGGGKEVRKNRAGH